MKKFLKEFVCASFLVLVSLAFSPIAMKAASTEWGVGITPGGGIAVGVGSQGSGAGNVWGGGMMGGGWALSNPYGLPQGSILGIASNLLFWLLALFAIVGIIGFVLSGIFYLLAGADEGNAEKGKEGMKWSIIGIIVGLSGYIIMQAVSALLSGSDKTF